MCKCVKSLFAFVVVVVVVAVVVVVVVYTAEVAGKANINSRGRV